MSRMRETRDACLAILFVAFLVVSGIPLASRGDSATGGEPTAGPAILVVGELDRMKSRNPLPALSDDIWTHDILDRVYDTVGKTGLAGEILPYILKGIDANENGTFETNEYGVFTKAIGTDPQNVIAYYDFNGVYFHDGVQATSGDLFFSYQLQAMNPRMRVDLMVLMDKAGKAGSNYSATRWLFVTPTAKVWQNEPSVGDPSLRFAVHFQLQEPFALFSRSTLADVLLFPRHVWEGTGWKNESGSTVTPLHLDVGQAIYPESDPRFGLGIPTTETLYKPYVYLNSGTPAPDSAEEWDPRDNDTIGTGPFSLSYYNDFSATGVVLKNPDYYSGNDSKAGLVIDPFVSTYMHPPYIDGILFRVYPNPTLGVLALQTGAIDFFHAWIAPDFLPSLSTNPDIRVWTSPGMGFTYLAYNMRRPSIGTWHWGQADQFDIGLHFRKAVAHLINKTKIEQENLQGYGVKGLVPVSPYNVRYYNSSLVAYDFSETQAQVEIGLAHQDALWLSTHGEPAAANWYTKDPGTGWYILPGIGTSQFNLLCPNADYDVISAISCTMIATEMQNMGINVVARPFAFSGITSLVNAHDFDMYILNQEIRTLDPDYLFHLFHSSNAAAGLNHGGFNDALSDLVLENSRTELNENNREWLIKWEQGILFDKLPLDTLFFRDCIEAARQDRFVGWIVNACSIWNPGSLLNLRPPVPNTPPIASFTASPPSGNLTTFFTFDASASSDLEDSSSALNVRWDWENDGLSDTAWSTTKVAQHQYSSPGTYTVRLEVQDTGGLTNSTTQVVLVDAAPPTVSITFPAEGQTLTVTPITVTGDALDAGGSGLQKVEVRVNGGGWSDAQGTSSWTSPADLVSGSNTIEARVWDNAGNPSATDIVNVTYSTPSSNTPPTATFSISPTGGDTEMVFTMTISASDIEDPPTALQFRWDWQNDGVWDTGRSNATTAQHRYPHLGTYTIKLEVNDTGGLANSTTKQVRVILAPPFNVSAVAGGTEGTINVAWEHSTPEDVGHYVIYVYETESAVQPLAKTNSTTRASSISGLVPGKVYWFDIVAVDASGNMSYPSERISGVAASAQPASFPVLPVSIILLVVVLVIVAALILMRRRKKEEGQDQNKT